MFPLRDDTRPERAPIVNWVLVLANVAVFAYMAAALPDAESQKAFAERFGVIPSQVRHGLLHPGLLFDAPWPFLRDAVCPLFTAMFVHGGLAHLVGNLWFLLIFGDNVEGRLGHKNYLAFYLVCGVVASALHIAMIPPTDVVGEDWRGALVVGRNPTLDTPMIGASGAIAGVLGAYVVMFPRARVLTFFPPIFFFPVPVLAFLGVWFVGQFLMARIAPATGGAGVSVAYWAHVGGFLAGLVLGLFAPSRPRVARANWR